MALKPMVHPIRPSIYKSVSIVIQINDHTRYWMYHLDYSPSLVIKSIGLLIFIKLATKAKIPCYLEKSIKFLLQLVVSVIVANLPTVILTFDRKIGRLVSVFDRIKDRNLLVILHVDRIVGGDRLTEIIKMINNTNSYPS